MRTRSCSLACQVVFSGAASHFHFAPSFYSRGTSSVIWRHKSLSLRYKSCNFNRQVKITTLQVLILAQQVTFSGIQVTFTCLAYTKIFYKNEFTKMPMFFNLPPAGVGKFGIKSVFPQHYSIVSKNTIPRN